MSIDKKDRQRGSDAGDAPLLLEGDTELEEADVVIGGEQSDQAEGKAADDLAETEAIEACPGARLVERFWRGWRGQGVVRRTGVTGIGWSHRELVAIGALPGPQEISSTVLAPLSQRSCGTASELTCSEGRPAGEGENGVPPVPVAVGKVALNPRHAPNLAMPRCQAFCRA